MTPDDTLDFDDPLIDASDDFSGMVRAAESSLEFWDNEYDKVWDDA